MWALFYWLILSVGPCCKRSCCSWHLSIVRLEFHLCEWRRLRWFQCSDIAFLVQVFQSHFQRSSILFFNLGVWLDGDTREVHLSHCLGRLPQDLQGIAAATILMMIILPLGSYPINLRRSISSVVSTLLCCMQEYFHIFLWFPVLRCLLLRHLMGSTPLAILLLSSPYCTSSSIPVAHLSFAPLRLQPPFEILLLPCTPFECRQRILFYWLSLWEYPWGSRLLVVFCRLLAKCLPVCCRCRYLITSVRP